MLQYYVNNSLSLNLDTNTIEAATPIATAVVNNIQLDGAAYNNLDILNKHILNL